MDTISSKISACFEHFEALLSAEHLEEYNVPAWAWRDERDRLRLWCSETGAREPNQLSLDFRLRDNAGLSHNVIQYLELIRRQLEEAKSSPARQLHDGELELWNILSKESSESESKDGFELDEGLVQYQRYRRSLRPPFDPSLTQLQVCHKYVISCISQLNGLTRMLLRPFPADHYVCFSDRNRFVLRFKHVDQEHVVDKFPSARGLSTRLGLSVSRCRAILKYRERCCRDPCDPNQFMFGSFRDVYPDNEPETTMADDEKTTSSSSPFEIPYHEACVRDFLTSVPPPPSESANRNSFQCPYCFYTIAIVDKESWSAHFFSDLRPYVCVLPDCKYGSFDNRGDWFRHMQEKHSFNVTPRSNIACPLCQEPLYGNDQAKEHIASHLEELALFALFDPFSSSADQERETTQIADHAASPTSAPQEQQENPSFSPRTPSVLVSPSIEFSSSEMCVDSDLNANLPDRPEKVQQLVAKRKNKRKRRTSLHASRRASPQPDIIHICCQCNRFMNMKPCRRCNVCGHFKCPRCLHMSMKLEPVKPYSSSRPRGSSV